MGIFVPGAPVVAVGDNPLTQRYADAALEEQLRAIAEGRDPAPVDPLAEQAVRYRFNFNRGPFRGLYSSPEPPSPVPQPPPPNYQPSGPPTRAPNTQPRVGSALEPPNTQGFGPITQPAGPPGQEAPGQVGVVPGGPEPVGPVGPDTTAAVTGSGVVQGIGNALKAADQYTSPQNLASIYEPKGWLPPGANMILGGLQGVDKAFGYAGQQLGNVWDFWTKPADRYVQENTTQGNTAPTVPGETIDFNAVAGGTSPAGGGGGSGSSSLLEYPAPQYPQPPKIESFQAAPPPEPLPIPAPPQVQMPDYSSADKWLEQARPADSTAAEREKLRREALFAGLASGAANWDYRTGWGGLIAGAGAGASQAALRARADELDHRDAFAKSLQQYALQRGEEAARRSGLGAEIQNQNASRNYNQQIQATNQSNQYNTQKYNIQQDNLQRAHEASLKNAENMYIYQQKQAELGAPKVQFSKDGALIQRQEGGKIKLEYQAFRPGTLDAPEMKKLKDAYGEDSPKYKLAVTAALLHDGNPYAVKYEMAKDALATGSAPQLFGQLYADHAKIIQDNLLKSGMAPGSKEYSAAFHDAMASFLATQIDWTNQQGVELTRQLAGRGSVAASYMLGGIKNAGKQ